MLENTEEATKGQSRETGNIDIQDTGQINARKYRRGNKRTIQRNWQHRVHKTQDK
jgi:hypothetical protein